MEKIESAVPLSTRKTTWAVNFWESWHKHCEKTGSDILSCLVVTTNDELKNWLARFVMEVRNRQGDPYIGGTLYGICAAIQQYI
jgi:hypothetical protein